MVSTKPAAPVEPAATTDPRLPLRWGGALLALLAGALFLRRRREPA